MHKSLRSQILFRLTKYIEKFQQSAFKNLGQNSSLITLDKKIGFLPVALGFL